MSSPEATLSREELSFRSGDAECAAVFVAPAGLGHFDVYRGELYERAIAGQLEFLARHLGV